MTDFFDTWEVGKDSIGTSEEMGSKSKFWHTHPKDDEGYWLFKHPRKNSGEHWAEKIAAEVASLLGISHARVELALFEDLQGSTTKSFVTEGEDLVHGNQLLSWFVHGYDPEKEYNQSSHTLSNIWTVMDNVFIDLNAQQDAKICVSGFLVLDALIGNTDRHHENWGILIRRVDNNWNVQIAPSFDHASSLGRELRDERREILLSQKRVGEYCEKGRGAIYWSEDDRHGLSPLNLVRRAVQFYPDLLNPALEKLDTFNAKSVEYIVNRVPMDWISDTSRKFTIEMMRYNITKLQELSK